MKNSDITTLGKVLLALEKYLPLSEKPLFDEYCAVFESLEAKNQKEKQAYQNKAEYHRDYTRTWKGQNPDKQKQYAQTHYQKKKQTQKQNGDEVPSMLAKLRKNKESIQGQSSAEKSSDTRSRSNSRE